MSAVPQVELPEPVAFTPLYPARFGRLLGDALLFASTDDGRPVLYGVLIEVLDDGRVQLVATNSYVLGWWIDDEGERKAVVSYQPGADVRPAEPERVVNGTFPATLYDRDGLAEIAKRLVKIKPGEKLTITLAHDALTATGDGWTLAARAYVHAQYPNWRQLLPDLGAEPEALPTPSIRLDWFALLGKLTLGQPKPTKRDVEHRALNYRTYGPLKPAAVTGSADGVEFVGLIMPVRVR